jgi:hypothetical protein
MQPSLSTLKVVFAILGAVEFRVALIFVYSSKDDAHLAIK